MRGGVKQGRGLSSETKLGHWTNYFLWCVYYICATFPYQRCRSLSASPHISFNWFLQSKHQPGPLLRHAGHQEETNRQQEVKSASKPLPQSLFMATHTAFWDSLCAMFIALSCVSMRIKTQLSWSVCICMDVGAVCITGQRTRESRGSRLWSLTTDVREKSHLFQENRLISMPNDLTMWSHRALRQ